MIIVNGKEHSVYANTLTFYDIVRLAASGPLPKKLTVTWKLRSRRGSLVDGNSIKIDDGMIFNVVETGAA